MTPTKTTELIAEAIVGSDDPRIASLRALDDRVTVNFADGSTAHIAALDAR